MATNVFAAREADLLVSNGTSSGSFTTLGKLREIGIDVTRNMIDASSFDSSGWTDRLTGQASWTVTGTAVFASTAATSQQDELRSFLSSESRKWWKLASSTAAGGNAFQGYAYVGGWSHQARGLDEVQLFGFTLNGDGKYVETSS